MIRFYDMHSDHLDANMIRSAKISENLYMETIFSQKHSDHLDANMIRSSKINENPCMKTTLFEKTMKIHYVLREVKVILRRE